MTHIGIWILRSGWLIGRGDQIENAGNHFFLLFVFFSSKKHNNCDILFCILISQNVLLFQRIASILKGSVPSPSCPVSTLIAQYLRELNILRVYREIFVLNICLILSEEDLSKLIIYVVTHIFCWPWLMWYERPCLAFLSCSSESQSTCVQVSDSRRPLINLATVIRG